MQISIKCPTPSQDIALIMERSINGKRLVPLTTRDGPNALAPAEDAFFRRLADASGEAGLKTDPLYATPSARMANRARISSSAASWRATHWIEVLDQAGVPGGPVNSVAEVVEDPQIWHQEMVLDVEHPGFRIVRMLGFPIKFSGMPCGIRRPAPSLGEHSDEILAELGCTVSDREGWRRDGVI